MSRPRASQRPQAARPAIFGEVLFDCFADGSRVPGGAPFNVAWHLQALGAAPLLLSSVGDDAMGRQIRETMARWGLSTEGLQTDPQHPTGEVQVSLDAGQPSFDIVQDRAYDHICAGQLPRSAVSVVYHGSLALRQPGSAAALDALLGGCDAPVFMDVNLRPPWWNAAALAQRLDRTRWVKLNEQELDVLEPAPGEPHCRAMRLLERHALEMVILTMGERGALLLTGAGERIPGPPVYVREVVDSVGAGDAFAAVCLLGLLRGWPLATVVARAQDFAARVVGQRGATVEDPGLYRKVLDTWAHPDA